MRPHRLMKFFRQLLTRNIWLKCFSLILAFIIWRMITSEDIAEVGFNVPLELRNIPEGAEVVGDVVDTVNLRVRSSSRLINRLSSADMYVSIDLAHAPFGEHTYPLSSSNVRAPVGVDVVRVIPTHVKLRLDRTIQRTVPVKPRWHSSIPNFKKTFMVTATPAQVQIKGPESRVNAINQISTDDIDLSGVSPNQPFTVNLSVDDPTIRLSQERVTVRVVASSKARSGS